MLGVGKLLSNISNSKMAMGTLALGAFGLGMANKAAPAARDAAFDFALGDPNADVAFTGRKIDTRFLVGNVMSGPVGFLGKASAPSDFFRFSAGNSVSEQSVASGAIGGATLGAAVFALAKTAGKGKFTTAALTGAAGIIGAGFGSSAGLFSPVPNAQQGIAGIAIGGALGSTALGMTAKAFGMGKFTTAAAIGIGGLGGAAIGGGSSLATTRRLMNENRKFYSESPFRQRNSSSNIAASTNAVGDIVLGMHNSRRGY